MITKTSNIVSKTKESLWVDNSESIDGTFCYGLTKRAIEIMLEKKVSKNTEVWGPVAKKLNLTRKVVPQLIKVSKKK